MAIVTELSGQFGRYQLWVCFIIFLNKFGIALHHMAIIFLAPPATYVCPNNATCCDNPVYDKTVFTRTIVTEWGLICGKAWLAEFTQTLFQLGVLLGSILYGMASDKYGRRKALIHAVVMEVIAGIIASFLPDYWSFTLVRMVVGFAVGGVMVVGFVIAMEYVGNSYRDLVSALYQIPFTLGHMLLAAFGYVLRDYSYFQLAISLSTVILLFYICLLPETPRWLLAKRRTDEAVNLIERIASINNLETGDIRQKVEAYQVEQGVQTTKGTVLDLFRTPTLRINIIVMSFNWLVCSYCFYGVSQYISHLTGNIFINVLASGIVAMCGVILSIPMMWYLGRKTIVIISNFGCCVCLLIIAVIPEGVGSTVLGCLGVLFSFIVFVVVYLYSTELFPTVVRNAAVGICSMMARVGAMLAPFVAGLRPYGQWCAPVAFGFLPLVAAGLCFLLPETKDCELLNTIEEAEAIGRRLRPGDVPLRRNDTQ